MKTPKKSDLNPKAFAVCDAFMRFSYDLLGAYLDALAGLEAVRKEVIREQNEKIEKLRLIKPHDATVEFMDQQVLDHRFGANQNEPEEILHRSTQGAFKHRTAFGGADARFLGQMMVALLYGAWEDKYRQEAAFALGHSDKNELKSELFSDVAKLRHAIVHNNGKATKEVGRAKVIKWFQENDEIFISRVQARNLLEEIDHFITQLCSKPCQPFETS